MISVKWEMGVQSCRTVPLTCGFQCYLWVDSVRIELDFQTSAGVLELPGVVGENPSHTLELDPGRIYLDAVGASCLSHFLILTFYLSSLLISYIISM